MRIDITKKLLVFAIGLILLALVGAVLSYGSRLISIGTAYKAKMLCSEVFVAGRDTNTVLGDLIVDDLAALRIISSSIDSIEKTATASLYGFAECKTYYRGDCGCALSSDEVSPVSYKIRVREGQDSARYPSPKEGQPIEPEKISSMDNPRLMAVLDHAFSEPNPEHPQRTRAVLIVHKGYIVAERYADDIGPNTPLLGWSMTKSVMNALVGILIKEGLLALDTPILAEAWSRNGDPRRNIKLEDLLHMSSGLEFDEDMTDPLADVSHMLLKERDMAAYAADKSLQADPGSLWQYSSGTTNIMSGLLRRVLGDEAYYQFPRKALFNPLGMTRAVFETDAAGTFVGSSFLYATAREWARFGLLYLQDGIWEGERILPEGWVQYTRTPAPADPQAAYGAHFWLRIPKEYRGSRNTIPADAFHAVGHEGQFVTIVPSYNMVIVRFGKTRYPQAWRHDVFVSNVLTALDEVK
ncbi:MAG: serine hydrolase domain-containing protein [bacterium]